MPGPAAGVKIAEKTHLGNILTRRTALTACRTSARRTMCNRTATVGLLVLTLSGGRISAMTRFDGAVLAGFGLPRTIAG